MSGQQVLYRAAFVAVGIGLGAALVRDGYPILASCTYWMSGLVGGHLLARVTS